MTPCEPAEGPGFRAIVCRRGAPRRPGDEEAEILEDIRLQAQRRLP